MFNIRQYRLAKKIYSTKSLLNNLNLENSSRVFLKNGRSAFLIKLVFSVKYRKLVPGLKNVCSLTGKYKSTFNSMRVSRHVYRELGGTSMLPNYSKLSWICLKTLYLLI